MDGWMGCQAAQKRAAGKTERGTGREGSSNRQRAESKEPTHRISLPPPHVDPGTAPLYRGLIPAWPNPPVGPGRCFPHQHRVAHGSPILPLQASPPPVPSLSPSLSFPPARQTPLSCTPPHHQLQPVAGRIWVTLFVDSLCLLFPRLCRHVHTSASVSRPGRPSLPPRSRFPKQDTSLKCGRSVVLPLLLRPSRT